MLVIYHSNKECGRGQMKEKKYTILFFTLLLFFCFTLEGAISYSVEFQGVETSELDNALKASSQLLKRSEHSVASMGVLKRRSEADVVNFVKVLHAFAYYNGRVEYAIIQNVEPILIRFTIFPGPVYPFGSFRIIPAPQTQSEYPFDQICLAALGITLGEPAYAEEILIAEDKLLQLMAEEGYPSASIKKRDVVADQQHKNLNVTIEVDSGPRAYFGITKITGNCSVCDAFFYKKILWYMGQPFCATAVNQTQEALESSGLFKSTSITYGDPDPITGELPIDIQVSEAKQRSIAGGVSYTTQRGPGIMAEWEHRNVRGMGEKVNVGMNIWKDTQDARFSYVLPDFKKSNRDLTFLAEVEHEYVEAYTETSFSLSGILDRKVNDHLKLSYGLMYKYLLTERSDDNGNFHLLKAPMQLRYSTANSLLDPTTGYSINLKTTPTVQLKAPHFLYFPTTFIGTIYQPLTEDHRFVLAAKAIVGSIVGPSRHNIPPSERFYAGTENTLRGYRYLTVSPLNEKNKPVGGRSIMVFSFEARMRMTETLGLVGFYEIGNVYGGRMPNFNHKQLESVGAGVRYHTPIGPIRLDVAVPLNRRIELDSPVQVYLSIGQSF